MTIDTNAMISITEANQIFYLKLSNYNRDLEEVRHLDISNYKKYISEKTMMGPNSIRILEELFD